MEYLFEKERFDEYRNNEKIKKYLEKNKLELLNKVEFKERFIELINTPEKFDNIFSKLCVSNSKFNETNEVANMFSVLNIDHIEDVFNEAFENNNIDYDIIFLMNKENNSLHGFLISHFGGCKMFPNTYVLELICSKNSAPLIGAYLYMITSINKDNVDKFGILELFRSFMNIKALCAYNKFGFKPDKTNKNCFSNNITMTVNLNSFMLDDIINTVVSGEQEDKKILLDICDKYAVKEKMNLDATTKDKLLLIQKDISKEYNKIYNSSDTEKIKEYEKIIIEKKNEFNKFNKNKFIIKKERRKKKSQKIITPINNDNKTNITDFTTNITDGQANIINQSNKAIDNQLQSNKKSQSRYRRITKFFKPFAQTLRNIGTRKTQRIIEK